ncbi:MAG: DUF2550 family protein [Propionibacteriaceae bacterium]
MDMLEWSEVAIMLLLATLAAIVIGLFSRRRWLSRHSGSMDCALLSKNSRHWTLGLARYHNTEFQWFQIFWFSWRPQHCFKQGEWVVTSSRVATDHESIGLFSRQQVVTLTSRDRQKAVLGMDQESAMGLCAWLEAASPGVAQYGNTSA